MVLLSDLSAMMLFNRYNWIVGNIFFCPILNSVISMLSGLNELKMMLNKNKRYDIKSEKHIEILQSHDSLSEVFFFWLRVYKL